MKKCISFPFGILLASCVGCQTIQVKRAATPTPPSLTDTTAKVKSVPGIPFYVKKAACLHSVIWFEPVYTLTLQIVTTSKAEAQKSTSIQIGSTTLSLTQLKGTEASDVFRALNQDEPSMSDVMTAWVKLTKRTDVPYIASSFPDSKERILIADTSEPQVYVDYSQPYYLNAKRPIAGSVKLDNKLASDGTLTEVSAEVEDKTIEAIGTAVKDIASAVGSAAKSTEAVPVQQLKLTIATGGFKHTLSKYDLASTLPCAASSSEIAQPYSYTRVDIATSEKKVDPKGDSKGSKIVLSGEITLPESKGSETTQPKQPPTPAAPAATKPKK